MKIISNNDEIIETFEDADFKLKKYLMCQISRCKFDITTNECSVKAMYQGEEVDVIFSSDDIDVYRFLTILNGFTDYENSIHFMSDEIYAKELNRIYEDKNRTVIDMLRDYKLKYFITGKKLNHTRLYKLYSDKPLTTKHRKFHNINYIDYNKQLNECNNIIHDEGIAGLWAFPAKTIVEYINMKYASEYGNKLYVVSPIEDCYYLDTGKEVIGDKYKVEFSILLHNIDDIGTLIKYLLKDTSVS